MGVITILFLWCFSLIILGVLMRIASGKNKIDLFTSGGILEKSTVVGDKREIVSGVLVELEKDKTEKHFPFRYLHNEHNKILPIVMVSGFFRDKSEVERLKRYQSQGIQIVGITAYKTFPKPIHDPSENTTEDSFDYLKEIKHWFCCFKRSEEYGFTSQHMLVNMSESDFYDAEETISTPKKYDFIYVCLRDVNDDISKTCKNKTTNECCPKTGWNAINRNFELALSCFPIMIDEMGLRGLVVGRIHCGLEQLYGDRITVVDFLPYAEFQQKIRESRFLFVPNVYDASPRVVSEALIKDVPVLINSNIVCGSKYIHDKTGAFFTDAKDIRASLQRLVHQRHTFQPHAWWKKHHSCKKAAIKMCGVLKSWFPELPALKDTTEVYFYK